MFNSNPGDSGNDKPKSQFAFGQPAPSFGASNAKDDKPTTTSMMFGSTNTTATSGFGGFTLGGSKPDSVSGGKDDAPKSLFAPKDPAPSVSGTDKPASTFGSFNLNTSTPAPSPPTTSAATFGSFGQSSTIGSSATEPAKPGLSFGKPSSFSFAQSDTKTDDKKTDGKSPFGGFGKPEDSAKPSFGGFGKADDAAKPALGFGKPADAPASGFGSFSSKPPAFTATQTESKPSGLGFGSFGGDKPSFGGDKPSFGGDKPSFGGDKPSFGGDKPAFGGSKLSFGGDKSAFGESKPSFCGDKPAFGGSKPSFGGDKPAFGESKPSFGGDKPAFSESKPSFGGDKPAFGGSKPSFGGDKPSLGPSEGHAKGSGFGSSLGSGFGAGLGSAPAKGAASTGFGASGGFPKPSTGGFGSSASGLTSSNASKFGSAGGKPPVSAPSAVSTNRKPTSTSNLLPGQRTALKQNQVFTAIGSTLYHNYLGTKDNTSIATVGFPIDSLILNPSGTLVALIGAKNISVVTLTPDLTNCPVQDLTKELPGSVMSALWNPISDPDATLEVLSDNVLVSLTLSPGDDGVAKTSLNLVEENDLVDSLGDVVSFSYGHGSDVMGLLSLYLLNSEGDVFCVAPWMPQNALLTQPEVQGILDQAIYLKQSTTAASGVGTASAASIRDFGANLVWCYDLWRQCPLAQKDVRHGMVEALKLQRPAAPSHSALRFQGPFVVSPYPEELYTETAKQLVTIKSQNVSLFAELFESGRVNILMYAGGPVTCQWVNKDDLLADEDEEEDELALRELILLESIDIKNDSVLSQCLHDGLVHSITPNSVVQIDTRHWYRKLAAAYVEQDLEIISQLQKAKVKSSQVTINLSPVYGVGTYTGRLILVSDEIHETDLDISEHGDLNLGVSELEKPQEAAKTATDIVRNSLISSVSPEIIHIIKSINLQPDMPKASFSMSEKLRQHPEMVQVFSQVAAHYSNENLKLQRASILMERRLVMQQSELRRQLTDLNSVLDRFYKLRAHHGDGKLDEFKKLIERQALQERRIDDLLTKLNRTQSLPLSDAERKWHAELGRVRSELEQYKVRIADAKVQAREVSNFSGGNENLSSVQGISASEFARTNFMMEEETRVVEEAREKLEGLLSKSQSKLESLKAR